LKCTQPDARAPRRARTAAEMERSMMMVCPNSSGRYASVPALRMRTTTRAMFAPVLTSPLLPVSLRLVLRALAPCARRIGAQRPRSARGTRWHAQRAAHQRDAERCQDGGLAAAVFTDDEVDAGVELHLQRRVAHEVGQVQALDVAGGGIGVLLRQLRLRHRGWWAVRGARCCHAAAAAPPCRAAAGARPRTGEGTGRRAAVFRTARVPKGCEGVRRGLFCPLSNDTPQRARRTMARATHLLLLLFASASLAAGQSVRKLTDGARRDATRRAPASRVRRANAADFEATTQAATGQTAGPWFVEFYAPCALRSRCASTLLPRTPPLTAGTRRRRVRPLPAAGAHLECVRACAALRAAPTRRLRAELAAQQMRLRLSWRVSLAWPRWT
jgi:hypothetical protein